MTWGTIHNIIYKTVFVLVHSYILTSLKHCKKHLHLTVTLISNSTQSYHFSIHTTAVSELTFWLCTNWQLQSRQGLLNQEFVSWWSKVYNIMKQWKRTAEDVWHKSHKGEKFRPVCQTFQFPKCPSATQYFQYVGVAN